MNSSHSGVLAVCFCVLGMAYIAIHGNQQDDKSTTGIRTLNDIWIGMTQEEIEKTRFEEQIQFFSNMRMSTRGYRLKKDDPNLMLVVYRKKPSGVYTVMEKRLVPFIIDKSDEKDLGDPPIRSVFEHR